MSQFELKLYAYRIASITMIKTESLDYYWFIWSFSNPKGSSQICPKCSNEGYQTNNVVNLSMWGISGNLDSYGGM